MNKYWFKPKTYGWGFVPISWEGWLMTLIFIGILLGCAYLDNFFSPQIQVWDTVIFLGQLAFFMLIFIFIAKPETKGKLKWRWGDKD